MAYTDNFRPLWLVDPTAPRYVEAYPRFNSLNAEKAIRGGATVCEFMEGRRLVGRYIFRRYLDDAVLPRWILGSHQILGSRHIPADFSEVAFRTVNMTNGKWARYYVLCQICQKPKAILAFTRWWACQRCHQLLHLSQVMDPVARRHAEYLEIQSRLKAGRQKGEHSKTIFKLKRRSNVLARWLNGRQAVLRSAEQDQVVEARWVRLDDALLF